MKEYLLTNIDIVLYALSLLGGATKKVPSENIAIKSFELEPSRFSWRLYPQYPDIEAVRISLFDARKRKNGNLVSGRYGKATGKKVADGWIFSPEGILWLENNQIRITRALGSSESPIKRTEISKKLNELESSVAFRKYIKDGSCSNIKTYEFTDFLNASLDTPASILRDRIAKVRALSASGKKQKLLDFVELCEKYFSGLLKI